MCRNLHVLLLVGFRPDYSIPYFFVKYALAVPKTVEALNPPPLCSRGDNLFRICRHWKVLVVSWFGFACLCAFASLREITSLVQQFSREGAESQRKTAK